MCRDAGALSPFWTGKARAALAELLEGPPGVAAFDFDDTCIRGDIGDAVLFHLAETGRIPGPDADAGVLGGPTPPGADPAGFWIGTYERLLRDEGLSVAYPWCTQVLAGWTPGEVEEISRAVLALEAARPRGRRALGGRTVRQGIEPRRGVVALVGALAARGWRTYVVTASARWVVEAAAQALALPVTGVLGQEVELEPGPRGQRLTNRVLRPMVGPGKVEALRAVAGGPDLAVGDGWNDLALFAAAGRAVLLDRGDAGLAEAVRGAGGVAQPAPDDAPEARGEGGGAER